MGGTCHEVSRCAVSVKLVVVDTRLTPGTGGETTYVGNVDFRGVLPPKEKRKTLEYSHLVVDVGGLQLFLGENLARELQFAPYHEGILDTTSYKSLPSKHYRYYS